MTADVVALARQPDRWIRDEGEADLVFECLHRSEDPVAACRAIDAICSGMSDPRFALRLPSCRPRSTATGGGGGGGGGGVPSTTTVPPPLDDDTPLVPVTMLFSRVFSLLDGLDCWRLMSPQLRRLISLNPSAFAGAVIARAAIHSSRSGGGGGGGGGGDGGIDVGGSSRRDGKGGMPATAPASKRPCFALAGDKMTSLNPPAEGKKSGVDSSSGLAAAAAAAGVSADSWRAVAGDVLASAMPEVARGRMQGVRGCCAVVDRSCSSGAVLGCDAAYSPLPLMVRALQDIAGDIAAARMVRDTFSWVVRGERDLEEAPGATLAERERRLDQLGSLVWTLGDLRRSLSLHGEGAGKSEAATGAGGAVASGDDGSGGGGASLMRVVVEQMEVHLVGVLDTAASMPLPECPFPSYKMDSGYACEHAGCPAPGFERDEECCVTCMEVVKPFLDSPYECWTSWVPWAGIDGDKFSPGFYQRLGLQCSIEGGAVKAVVLTKPHGTMAIHDAMQPVRDALYLRDRALNLLTSANSLAWLHFDAEERLGHCGDPSGGGGSGAGGGDGDGYGGGSGDGDGGVIDVGVDLDVDFGFSFDVGSGSCHDGGGKAASTDVLMTNNGFRPGVGGAAGGPVGGGGGAGLIAMDFDAVAAAAAEASSENWHTVEDSNDRREFVGGGGDRVDGVAATANAARSTPGPTGRCCWEQECPASSRNVGVRACVSHGGANGTNCAGAGRAGARRRFDREGVLVEKRVWEERGEAGEGTSGEKNEEQPPSLLTGAGESRAKPTDGGQGVRVAENGSAGLEGQGAAVRSGGSRHRFAGGVHTAHGGEPAAAPVSCCAAGARAAEQRLVNAELFQGQTPNDLSSTVFPEKKAVSSGTGAAAKTPAEEAVEAVAAAVAANDGDTSEGMEESGSGCIQS
ncbi:expressed unknown protein [Ectocarpus siliculosus]|uniref:Uncharacterized protein n=1 Tax=Ectocarpus siliculosus TaxID=2880 RepID=D7FPL7_ECTSI|nr:expressed unknown protein [Ectocarpus siliculosus]|eukprot:CBJ30474.1 expressed unknown protein [Ectocarpus siliculosus]